MRDKPAFRRHADSAEYDIILRAPERVRIYADTHASESVAEIFRVGKFYVLFFARAKFRLADVCRVYRGIVGEIGCVFGNCFFVCGADFRKIKALRRLYPIGVCADGVGENFTVFVRRGKRIGGGHGTHAATVFLYVFYAGCNYFRGNERTRAVVD